MSEPFNGSAEERGVTPKRQKMTDDDVRYITDREITDSYDYTFSKIAIERAKAMQYYLGLPVGDLSPPAIPGRSSIVSTDVEDTIEWLLPALMEIFTAGDEVVEFKPKKPGDEEGAQQTTDVVNHVFYEMNPGWFVLYTWFKDALIQKNGLVKAWWDPTPEKVREEYHGLTDIQFTMLMQDENVEPVEHSAYPDPQAAEVMSAQTGMPAEAMLEHAPMLHDVVVIRTNSAGKVCVENVPPEEFLISRQAKCIGDGSCGHRVKRTISYLRASGYKNVDDITSDNFANPTMNQEAIVRRSLEDAPYGFEDGDGEGDPSMREVWLTEWYTQIDYDGDGIAEWRKIVRAGNAILENVECDGPPFVSLCAVPIPHLFFGRSPAEQSMQTQRLKTTVIRGLVDNMAMQVNGRVWAIQDQVNLDDLLTNRPGGVVRVKSQNAVGPLQQGMSDAMGAYQLLEYADEMKQNRTGVTKYTQGSDADTLNKTAAGLNNITQRADMRVKLIARMFAETGVKDLFRLIQKLLAQYQDRAMTIKLRGSWVDVDPRAWKNQYNMTANVGLGTGDKSLMIQHLMTLGQAQAQAMQIGVATPQNIYSALKKLPPLLGFKDAEQFFTDPSQQPPPPPQEDPAIAKIKAQHETDMAELQLRQQTVLLQNEAEAARAREKLEAEIALKREEMLFKYGLHPMQEHASFQAAYQSTEGLLNGSGNPPGIEPPGPAIAPGAGEGPQGIGAAGEPPVAGGDPAAAAGIPGGMDQQPGAGF